LGNWGTEGRGFKSRQPDTDYAAVFDGGHVVTNDDEKTTHGAFRGPYKTRRAVKVLRHSRRTANVGVLENNRHAIQLLDLVDSVS
jgi:hypothetical protein